MSLGAAAVRGRGTHPGSPASERALMSSSWAAIQLGERVRGRPSGSRKQQHPFQSRAGGWFIATRQCAAGSSEAQKREMEDEAAVRSSRTPGRKGGWSCEDGRLRHRTVTTTNERNGYGSKLREVGEAVQSARRARSRLPASAGGAQTTAAAALTRQTGALGGRD